MKAGGHQAAQRRRGGGEGGGCAEGCAAGVQAFVLKKSYSIFVAENKEIPLASL